MKWEISVGPGHLPSPGSPEVWLVKPNRCAVMRYNFLGGTQNLFHFPALCQLIYQLIQIPHLLR